MKMNDVIADFLAKRACPPGRGRVKGVDNMEGNLVMVSPSSKHSN